MITRKTKQIVTFWSLLSLLFGLSGSCLVAEMRADAPSPIVINEFLAGNDSGPTDEQGNKLDWIEIYNRSKRAVNLSGWSLSDDPNRPDKWSFPVQTLGRDQYLVVYASGQDSQLHTNFKLSKTDQSLGLYNIFAARLMDELRLEGVGYFRDISYGRSGQGLGYFTSPTPGQANETTFINPEDVPAVVTFEAETEGEVAPLTNAPNEAAIEVAASHSPLRVTEIMYHPIGGNDYEFIEISNIGDNPLNLSGAYFEGIEITFRYGFPLLAPGDNIVLVNNEAAFAERYPGVRIADRYDGNLANSGERITIRDYNHNVLASVSYDDENGWPLSADGMGDSLILIEFEGSPNAPLNWRASPHLNGSPGTGLDNATPWFLGLEL